MTTEAIDRVALGFHRDCADETQLLLRFLHSCGTKPENDALIVSVLQTCYRSGYIAKCDEIINDLWPNGR